MVSGIEEFLSTVDGVIASKRKSWAPPPRLSLNEWANEHFYLPSADAAPGRWHSLPYQVGILDAITDPKVVQVTVKKSARVGYTQCLKAAIGYYIHQDPSSILVVQPTLSDAKGFSKEDIAPMLRDCPALAELGVSDLEDMNVNTRNSQNTILHKKFPDGVLSMTGANSGEGFRRISRSKIFLDEVDAYPPSAGDDGDPVKLAIRRSETYWNRKILAGSTPLLDGVSRISQLFEDGDQRRFYVPCPHCGHMDFFVWRQKVSDDVKMSGHRMKWPKGSPEDAHFVCSSCDDVIEHRHKREIVGRGEWRAAQPFAGHASFHIWAAYSFSPNATWAALVREFLSCKDDPDQLKTFVNTTLGETWKERGDAPEWERLFQRRESYSGVLPAGVEILTAGVDVQKDRFVVEVVGWGVQKENWSIQSMVIPVKDTADLAEWKVLEGVLEKPFMRADGTQLSVRMMAVDSGYNANQCYAWTHEHRGRAMAIKGSADAKSIVGTPTPVEIRLNGKRAKRGAKVWIVGSDIAKRELYGWLRLERSGDGPPPIGWCHFGEHNNEDFFKQLTAEVLVTEKNNRGFLQQVWTLMAGRENHHLDARVYARVAAVAVGVDHLTPPAAAPPPPPPPPQADGRNEPELDGRVIPNRADYRFRGKKGWLR